MLLKIHLTISLGVNFAVVSHHCNKELSNSFRIGRCLCIGKFPAPEPTSNQVFFKVVNTAFGTAHNDGVKKTSAAGLSNSLKGPLYPRYHYLSVVEEVGKKMADREVS